MERSVVPWSLTLTKGLIHGAETFRLAASGTRIVCLPITGPGIDVFEFRGHPDSQLISLRFSLGIPTFEAGQRWGALVFDSTLCVRSTLGHDFIGRRSLDRQ